MSVVARIRKVRTALAFLLVGAVSMVGACSATADANTDGVPETLRVGIIPNISPDDQRALYEPFRTYLAETLDVEVELFVATDYAGVVVALVSEQIDIAYVGGLTYAQARQEADVVPLVTEVDRETDTERYLAAMVVLEESEYQSTEDVVSSGGTVALGDVSSTSGSLYPRRMLIDAGAQCDRGDLFSCPPLGAVVYTGGHDAAAQAVLNGSADAAGLELRILHRLEANGNVPAGALRVIDTREVMGYPWVARAGLNDEAREAIVAAFTSIEDETLLALMRAERYVPVTEEDFIEIEEYGVDLGLLTTR